MTRITAQRGRAELFFVGEKPGCTDSDNLNEASGVVCFQFNLPYPDLEPTF
jgi:hypothetical protein